MHSDLTDAQWELIEPLLPPFGENTFCETVARREIVNGIQAFILTEYKQKNGR